MPAVIANSMTGADDLYWYVPASSPIKSLQDACFGRFRPLRQRLQIAARALVFAIQLAQLAYRAADGALGLAQFVGSFLAVRLRVAKLLLQGLQAPLEGFEFGLLVLCLAGAGAPGRCQHQQDEEVSGIHPGELTRTAGVYSNLTRDSPVISGGCGKPIMFRRVGLMSSSAPVSANEAWRRPM